jgi:hypothetical protein
LVLFSSYSRIRDPRPGAFSPPGSGIWIRDKKVRDPDPGYNIPDPQHWSVRCCKVLDAYGHDKLAMLRIADPNLHTLSVRYLAPVFDNFTGTSFVSTVFWCACESNHYGTGTGS